MAQRLSLNIYDVCLVRSDCHFVRAAHFFVRAAGRVAIAGAVRVEIFFVRAERRTLRQELREVLGVLLCDHFLASALRMGVDGIAGDAWCL